MKYTVTLTLTLVISVLIWVHLIQPGNAGNLPAAKPDTKADGSPVFSLNSIYKGVCWTGEPRRLPDDAIDTVKAYGVEWISLTPFGWMQTQHTPAVKFNTHHGWWGETDEGIRTTTREAHQKDLKVMLKPHLWIMNPSHGNWRGTIDFKTEELWQQWEADYTRFIMYYAQMADKENIEILCIGTEFTNPLLSRPQYWKNLIRDIRSVYSGKLTYAANWYRG